MDEILDLIESVSEGFPTYPVVITRVLSGTFIGRDRNGRTELPHGTRLCGPCIVAIPVFFLVFLSMSSPLLASGGGVGRLCLEAFSADLPI